MVDAMIDTAAAGLPYLVFGMILGFLFACLAFATAWDRLGRGRGNGGAAGHADWQADDAHRRLT